MRVFSFIVVCAVWISSSIEAYCKTFAEVAAEAEQALAETKKELVTFREQRSEERLNISKRLTQAENEVLELRKISSEKESARFSLKASVQAVADEVKAKNSLYNSQKSAMAAYIEKFSKHLSPIEFQRIKGKTDLAEQLESNKESVPVEVVTAQLDVLRLSLERLKKMIGGTRLKGTASGEGKTLISGDYVLVGPIAFFTNGSDSIGIALEDTNKAYPIVFDKSLTETTLSEIDQISSTGRGFLPLDPTNSDAIKWINANEGFVEHIRNGGITMVPLIGMFLLAVAIAIFKAFEINSVKSPPSGTIFLILEKLHLKDKDAALEISRSVKGPFGDLLVVGVEHADEPKEVLEEALYERMLAAQPKLERYISFIALSAASAPLLGLLGTVTGMIQTFSMINTYGTGDPATLSDGISVALITTEYGLIAAVPCLVVQVILSRIAKGKLFKMEQASLAFANGLKD